MLNSFSCLVDLAKTWQSYAELVTREWAPWSPLASPWACFHLLLLLPSHLIQYNADYGFSMYCLGCCCGMCLPRVICLRFLLWKSVWSNAFSASVEVIVWLLFLHLLMYHIHGLYMLNYPCFLGTNPTSSGQVVFLVCWIQWAGVLVSIFCLCLRNNGLQFLAVSFSGFRSNAMLASQKFPSPVLLSHRWLF